VTFESTNFVGKNQSIEFIGESVQEGWTHNQEYVFLPFSKHLESNESTCDVIRK